ncbi:hypothetical protein N0V84_001462 [Fusarium piperis]|uniref:Uncharacterized protein n=1 Tax=Fusarium piperis TaxID=1435070 RepID=A0A9W8WLT7_9HYPO|nr:hypothetical protein N0V84_001462 [Fusarium piperis]
MPPRRHPARRESREGPVYSPQSIEAKRLRLFVRTDEGDEPTQVDLDFLPSYSPDDGALRIKIGRNSDDKRSIGWLNHPGRDVVPPLHRETLPGVVDLFPGGKSIVRDQRIFFNILAALFAIFIIFISNPPNAYISHFIDARGIRSRDPLHNQDPWTWGLEVKSLLAQLTTDENTGSFHPAYDEMFHKHTVSYDPPLVGDLMSAVSQLGYSSRQVLVMPFRYKTSRKHFRPDKFFESLVHGLNMIRPHRPLLTRISHETANYYPSFMGMHGYVDDQEQDEIRVTAQRVFKRWTELRELVGKNMVQLFDELNQLGDNLTKTIDESHTNIKVINLFEAFLSPGSLIQTFPDELDKYLLTLIRDVNKLREALELPNEISMLLLLEKGRENKLSLQEILSEGAEDPTDALKYLEDLHAMSTVQLMLFHLEEAYRGLRLERLSLKHNSLRAQSMQTKTIPTKAWWKGCWVRECLPSVPEIANRIFNGTMEQTRLYNEALTLWNSIGNPSRSLTLAQDRSDLLGEILVDMAKMKKSIGIRS